MNIRPGKVAAALLLTVSALCAGAREATDFFADAPPSVINIFDRYARLDMIEYYRSGLSTPTNNVVGGKSKVSAIGPRLVTVDISDNTRLDVALVNVKGDTVVAVIETVKTPIPDSFIRFYRTDWSRAASPAMPTSLDFASKKQRAALGADAPLFDFITAEFVPEKNAFVFTNHTAEYFAADERPELLNVADSTLTMRYDGKKFVRAK